MMPFRSNSRAPRPAVPGKYLFAYRECLTTRALYLLYPADLCHSRDTCGCQLPTCRNCWTRSVMPRAWRAGSARSGNSLTRRGCLFVAGAQRYTGATAISSTGTHPQETNSLRPACQQASSTKKLGDGRLCSRRYGRGSGGSRMIVTAPDR